jgi:DNA repair protein RecO (recombination protein O)
MHQIQITNGIVLRKRAVGEENTLVFIFTEELGLVRAVARAGRRENSKLRYGLEPLTQGRYSFVRGRHEWRLVGVEDISRELVAAEPLQRRRMGQVASLLMRLVLGAEPNAPLYKTVVEGFATLARVSAEGDSVECVLVLRILANLGYVPELPALSPFITDDPFSPELAAQAAASRALLIKLINDSLQATGL